MTNARYMKTDGYICVWNECLKIIKDNISSDNFKTWFTPIKPIALQGSILTLQLPTLYYYEILEGNYLSLLKTAIRKILGQEGRLEYKILFAKDVGITLPPSNVVPVENPEKQPGIDAAPPGIATEIANPFVLPGLQKVKIESQLNPNLNFENFIEGECNRLARSAGLAIARDPGKTAFNPLFIYSPVGLGKTHLSHAIGLETKSIAKDVTVVYVTAEQFIQQYVEAAKSSNISDFINFYQLLDVLIIDDIQFLSGKGKTQEALFHIFNYLHQRNKQLIFASDKSPSEITGFDQRLLSRFKWGLSADLQVPDKQTRIKIIHNKLYINGISGISEEVIEYLANHVVNSVREIESAIIAILAQISFNKKTNITVDLAKQMIDKFVQSTTREMSIEFIQRVVCDYFRLPREMMCTSSRKRELVQARQIAMYFSRKFTNSSMSEIGAQSGKKDHATVLHSIRTVENCKKIDKNFKNSLDEIERLLKNS